MASQPFLTVQEAGSPPLPTNVEDFSGPELGTGLLCPAGRSQGKAMAGNVASLWFQEQKEMSVASGKEDDLL